MRLPQRAPSLPTLARLAGRRDTAYNTLARGPRLQGLQGWPGPRFGVHSPPQQLIPPRKSLERLNTHRESGQGTPRIMSETHSADEAQAAKRSNQFPSGHRRCRPFARTRARPAQNPEPGLLSASLRAASPKPGCWLVSNETKRPISSRHGCLRLKP